MRRAFISGVIGTGMFLWFAQSALGFRGDYPAGTFPVQTGTAPGARPADGPVVTYNPPPNTDPFRGGRALP